MKLIAAALWGFGIGILTLVLGPLSLVSENPAWLAVLRGASWLVLPGVAIGTLAGSLMLSVLTNVALHASLCWLVLRIVEWARGMPESEQDEAG